MSAIETIQTFLDLFESPSYLEIGVSEGLTLHAAGAGDVATAVEPRAISA